VQADAQDVSLDDAEPVRAPVDGGGRNACVEVVCALDHGFRQLVGERIRDALVQARERLARQVPLVEQLERLAARFLPARHALSPRRDSSRPMASARKPVV
jgi:hypothetical protein